MSLWTSLEPASATVDPGNSTTVRLRLRNTGDIVDEYRFEPVGDLAPWTTVEPQALRLYPGTTGTVELTFAPPRTPDATAGPNPYAVRITPTEHREAVTVPEGNLTITPFTEVRAELVPPTVKGRFRGRPRLAVDNLGNTKVTASLSGSDSGDRLSYDLRPGNVQIEPGRAAFVKATLRPRQIIWFGSKQEQPYSLAVRRSGAEPMQANGTYVQRGFLPGWLATTFGLLLALTIAFVMIWVTYQPRVQTAASEKPQEAGEIVPSPSAPISSPPTAPDDGPGDPPKKPAPKKPAPERPAPEKPEGGGGGGNGEEPEKEKKPAKPTAATAVRKVAALSEGRHICYRAYVAGSGWQKPVCDGAKAGTEGKDKPIKALNFAVSGTKGIAAAGAYVVEGWKKGEKWSSAVDGKDMFIGSTKKADSPLQGFTIQVFDGSVCQNAYVKDKHWLGRICTKDGQWKYGGSPMEQKLRLEAVRFTV
ncbi:hydrolase [Streptomyces sp. 2A115]|uniref:hydrolase n=1 Tax=Streptomyces sp. 2A115 TaxID=3457439 RepID=UPI003FD23DEB